MILEFCQERYAALEEELALFSEMGILPVKKLSGGLNSITLALEELRAFILTHPFQDAGEEIEFFKYEKPRFFAKQIFLLEQFTIESQKPPEDTDLQRTYYQNELKFVLRFFEQYKFQYGYFEMGATELDDKYFLRNAGPISMIMPVLPDRDPEFSTNADYLFAKFIAYEKLQDFIIKQLWDLSHPNLEQPLASRKFSVDLKWTGDSINLVEVAYGIWLTGQVNHGNATITEIIELLEEAFHVKIGRPFRRWTEIAQRKMVSPTKYIDHCKAEILKRIDDGNK
ncbi:RteC protein [Mucilaginibacter pineti]|uniref:RteC protein n=1 Tax=Mucilaginibacter pineti TaxID=1391627 RepID=A0A1G7N8G7_9SPHI|nr:RteC domain-containing protein [Mucilaginibacter pineti]SDF70343.1 RteC protein [Mucilaginibacter pineti]